MAHTDTSSQRNGLFLRDMLDPDLNSFGAVRLAMALAVVVSHCWYLASGSDIHDPFLATTGYTLGEMGVQVFFIVSGIMVARSLDRSPALLDFAAARALRIFPALIVCVLATAVLLGPVASNLSPTIYFANPGVWSYVVRTLSLSTGSAQLPGVFGNNPAPGLINISVWTLKYEVLCYAGLVAASLAWNQIGSRQVRIVFASMAVALLLVKRPILAPDNSFVDNIRYFAVFFATGAIAYRLREVLPVSWKILCGLGLLLLLALGSHVQEVAMAFFLGYVAIWSASHRMRALRPLTAERDLSYGVYIFSVPVTQLVLQWVPNLSVTALIAVTIVISLALAWLSWHMLEKPALSARPVFASLGRRLQQTVAKYWRLLMRKFPGAAPLNQRG